MAGYYIIGISGATNSGKSTLACQLLTLFPEAKHICQDSYFLEPGNKNLEIVDIPGLKHQNWEMLSAIDMTRMMRDVKEWVEDHEEKGDNTCPGLLIIEGILIYNHKELSSIFNKKYFLTLEFDVSQKRRQKRLYNPVDPPGYFERVVWPMYLSNLKDIKYQEDIVYITCGEDTDMLDLLVKIAKDIHMLHPFFERKHFQRYSQKPREKQE